MIAALYVNAGYGEEAERVLQALPEAVREREGRWWRLHAVALDLGRAKDEAVIAAYEQAITRSAGHRLERALRDRLARLQAGRGRKR